MLRSPRRLFCLRRFPRKRAISESYGFTGRKHVDVSPDRPLSYDDATVADVFATPHIAVARENVRGAVETIPGRVRDVAAVRYAKNNPCLAARLGGESERTETTLSPGPAGKRALR